MFSVLLLALSLGAGQQSPVASVPVDPALIRVHIQTDDGGDTDELASRRQSVRHLTAALTGRKKSGLVIVASPDDPVDIVIEVEGRGVTVPKVVIGLSGGMGPQAGRPGPAPTQVKAVQLRATIAIGRDSDPSALVNKNRANDSESGWKSAADDIAKQIEKWIAERKTAILEARRR
jgi:hypothetical protein